MSIPRTAHVLDEYLNRRVVSLLALGFFSGLPYLLTASTLQAWMTAESVDLRVIGLFSLVGLPYAVKMLWAPLMDRFTLPLLGRRRGWIAACQIALAAAVLSLGLASPSHAPMMVAGCAMLVAFLSASQDIVVDAYRADVVRAREVGSGAASSVVGYRVAMVITGAVALILSDHLPWRAVYALMAGVMLLGVAATLAAPEPEDHPTPPRSMRDAVLLPLIAYFQRRGATTMLVFIVVFKLGDVLAGALTTPFLLDLGFSRSEVGTVNKAFGLGATIVGTLLGGSMVARLGMNRSLWIFAFLQAASNLAFTALAVMGKTHLGLIAAVGIENLCGGMGTAGFVGFMMSLCDKRFTATQYALLSSLMGVARVAVGAVSGYLVTAMGWPVFFAASALGALPGIALLPLFAPWNHAARGDGRGERPAG